MPEYSDVTGAAGSAKYMYQASRAARGLGTTTRLTAAVDLLKGGTGFFEAGGAADVASSASTTAKGVTGGAKISKYATTTGANISRFGKVARFAGKAAPIVTKGSCVLGAALGGWDIGTGINHMMDGETAKGRDKIISGSADVVTAGALAVAATSSGTVIGLPVAGVALGVAGVAQAAKYGWKYRKEIAGAAKWAGGKVAQGAKAVANGTMWAAGKVKDGVVTGAKATWEGAKWVGNKTAQGAVAVKDGAVWAGKKVARGASVAADATVKGANWVGNKAAQGAEAVKDGAVWAGKKAAQGAGAAKDAAVDSARWAGDKLNKGWNAITSLF